jgi:hypothetical protein
MFCSYLLLVNMVNFDFHIFSHIYCVYGLHIIVNCLYLQQAKHQNGYNLFKQNEHHGSTTK